MPASLAAAWEQAQMKKSKSKGKAAALVHPAFPPQGMEQPSYMGSQSAPPMKSNPYAQDGSGMGDGETMGGF